jgi:cytochrome c peroxidase
MYLFGYNNKIENFKRQQINLLELIEQSDLNLIENRENIIRRINLARNEMKGVDLWIRYLEPLAYKKINGALPVEWETEVFEKFEKPYKREGAGLTLATLYLSEPGIEKKNSC